MEQEMLFLNFYYGSFYHGFMAGFARSYIVILGKHFSE